MTDNTRVFEIYTKDPITGATGWNIVFVRTTSEKIFTYPNFDCIITVNDYPMSNDRSDIVNF